MIQKQIKIKKKDESYTAVGWLAMGLFVHILYGILFAGPDAMKHAEYHNNKFGYTLLPSIKPMHTYHANAVSYGITFTISF